MPTGGGSGAGSLTTVTHDTTLTGAGTSLSPLGLLKVTTDATLTGDGIAASPLGVSASFQPTPQPGLVGPTLFSTITGYAPQANKTTLLGVVLPALILSHGIWLDVTVADNSHLYSFGIYNNTGTLIVATTPAGVAATGYQAFAWAGSLPVSFVAGVYWIAFTGTAATLNMTGTTADTRNPLCYGQVGAATGGTTSSGALNASGLTTPGYAPATSGTLKFSLF